MQAMSEIDRLETALKNAKSENERLKNVNQRLRGSMTETSKDFKRIEAEKWEEKADGCPARKVDFGKHCPLTSKLCSYQHCLFVHWLA